MNFKIFSTIFLLLFSFNIFAENLFSDEEESKRKYKIKTLGKEIRVPDDIPLFDKDNNKIFLDKFEGKTYLMAFWASWCAPCVDEMPALDLLKKDFRKLNFDVIPISQDFQGIKSIKEFYDKYDINYLDIYHDYRNQFFKELQIIGLPTSLIIDKDGYIRAIIEGAINWNDDDVRNLILEHIDGNPVMPKNSYKNKTLDIKIKNTKNKEINNDKSDKNEQKNDKE